MQPPEHFIFLFNYNEWANARYIEVVSGFSPDQFTRQLGHSWGSVHGTLVHMMSAEWIWLNRWKGRSPAAMLSPEDYPTLAQICARWIGISRDLHGFVIAQTSQTLSEDIAYQNTRGQSFSLPLWQLMAHLANHGTHHRGELAAMFATLEVPHPEEDLLIYLLSKGDQLPGE